ncbi:VCBS domain-containing protein [Enterovibrio sp. 27052020O]|uniref:VCBS domain-containing protein n=1 Tax=Enterovibrio sp. 27052020O TaxID=3241166 RepID=UPI00388D3FC4
MAITLVLSQVVGQAFVVKPDGQISPAQANMQLQTGDLVSVPNGKNAWLVTEDGEQVDVLDEALLLNDEGFDSLDLPSDVQSIIAALEEGDDPTQLEDTETAAGEELNSSSAGEQVIIESNGYRGGVSGIEMFDTSGLFAAGLTGAQVESLSSARYANLFNRASNAQEENIEAKISGDLSATITDGDVLTASGNLTSSDADGADNRFIAETIQTLRGEMTINEDGSWTYTSTDPTGAIERLGEGDTLNEYVTVRAADGTEQRITLTFEGSNDVPVFSAISSGEITESDGIMKAAGSINIVDPDAGESFMQPGSFKGEWGTVIIDRAGNWSYTVDNSNKAAINSMTDGEKVTDTITVYSVDGTETTITLTINGANDDAIIGGDITATVSDNSGTLSTSGTLTSADIDGNDNAFIAETLTTPRGEVTIDENGNWTYTSTDPTGAIERLAEGETLTEVVTVRAEDGTEQQIVLTIEGVNDAPVFSAITSRDVYETNDVLSVNGSLNIVDPDAGESFMLAGTYLGDFGSVTIDRAGNWTYTTDPSQSTSLDTLKEGEQRVDAITVRSVDGTETDILVTIIGTNDPAQIAGDIVGTIVEADGTLSTSGQLTSTDVDGNDNVFTPQTIAGRWGEITIDADGGWTYVTSDDKGAINRLGDGEQLTDTLSVRAEDGTIQTITITIDGTNDVAVFGGMTKVSVAEADGQLSTSGSVNVSDADTGQSTFQAGTFTGEFGDITIDTAGNWTYTTDPAHSNTFDALDAGDPLPDTITVYAQDGTPLDITVTITGTDDLPVVSGQFGQSLVDTTTGNTLSVSGTINISDVDADDAPTFENTRIESEYGVLELVDGEWTYTLSKEAASTLNAGEVDTDVITLTASDGTQQNIVISITGTDDDPFLQGNTIGTLTDGDDLTATGFIQIIDPDTGESPTLPNATVEGNYGSLELVDGEWTYTLNPDSVASLPEGETTTDVITITASDGSTHDITITITGTDQEPVLTGNTTGAIVEGSGTLTVTGTVDLIDVDTGENPTLPNGTTDGQYGSLTLVDGNWTYTLDPDLAQYLDEGQTTSDTISITASDGTVHDIVITITGSEDAAVLSGETSGSVSDETGAYTTGGSLSISDPDTNDNPTLPDTNQQGQYGSFTMVDGNWTYTLDPELAEALGEGVEVTDTITITDSMGGTHELVISVTGTDDAAVVSGDFTGNVTAQIVPEITINNVFVLGDDIDVDGEQFNANSQPNSMHFDSAGFSATITDSDGQLNNSANQTIEFDGQSYPVTVTATVEYTDVYDNVFTMGVLSIDNGDGTSTTLLVQIGGPDILPGTNLNVVEGSYTDVNSINYVDVTDANSVSGSLSISDADADDTPTFTNTTLEGNYGTFTLTDGAWTYTLDPSKANALNDNQTEQEVFTLTASDGTVQQITIDVTGADDAAVISGDTTAAITEDVGAQTASGTITITDADTGDTPTIPNGTLAGEYGSLTLVDGAWTYTADSASIQSLADGDTVTDTITVTASDGTTQDIVITIAGMNDAAVVTGDTTGDVTDQNASTSGSINVSDVDNGETATIDNTTIAGEYGSLVLVDGNWTYNVDSEKAQTLPAGQSANDVFTLTASDGSTHQITVTVEGTDDAAAVTGDLTASVAEGGEASVSGSININDPDATVQPTLENGTVAGEYGSLTLTDGEWTYTVDPSKAQSLGEGDSATDTITVTASDGSEHQITITVTGSDDASVVTGVTTGGIDLGADSPETSVSGTLSISDVDDGDSPSFTNTTIDGDYGTFTLTDGAWTYTIDPAKANALNDNQTEQEVFTLTASDGTVQQITVDVTGADDAAVISGDTTAAITEDVGAQTASGTITITDADTGDTPTIPNGTLAGEYGSLTLVDGAWTYTLNQEAAQSLNQDQEVTDTITVTASDGTTQDIVITVMGTDDAAEVSGTFTASVDASGFSLNASEGGNIQSGEVTTGDSNSAWNTTSTTINGVPFVISTSFGYSGTTIISRVENDGSLTETDRITYDNTAGTVISTSSGDITAALQEAGINIGALGNGLTQSNVSNIDGQPTLFLTSQNSGSITAWEISADGQFSNNGGITFGNSQTGIVRENVTFEAEDGTEYLFVTRPQGDTIDTFTYNPETGEFAETGNSIAAGDVVSGVDIVTVDGQSFLASSSTDGINIYSVNSATGGLTLVDSQQLDLSDGNSVNFYQTGDGTTYAIVSSGGSDNASIFEVGANGSMTLTDTVSGDGAYMSSAGYVDGEPVFVMPNATEGVDLYTINQEGDFVLQTTITDIENDMTPPVIVQTSDGSYYLVDGDGQSTTVKLDFGNHSDITVSGTLSISDVDSEDSPSFENTTIEGEYGSLTLTDGEWTYTLDPDKSQSVGEDQTATDTITLTATDGTTQDIVISVTGSNDAAVITGDTTAAIIEDVGTQSASGTLNIVDPDSNQTPTFTNETITGVYGSLTMVDGEWTYTVNSDAVQSLNQDQEVTDTITVTASDGSTQDIVISLTGTDDAAEISGTTTAALAEGNAGDTITASGTLTVTDLDGDAVDFPNSSHNGTYGSLEMVNGEWTYTMNNDATQSLNEGQVVQDTITVTASDGTTQDIVIDITGTDDAAVLSGTSTATITDTSASSQNVTVGRGSDGTWDVSNGDNLYLNLSNVGSDASYSNSVGYYVLDAGGNVVRAAIIFDNAHYTNGTSVNINTAGGEKVGLFIIPDGDSKGFNVGSVSLSFGGGGVTASQSGASGTAFVSDASKNGGYDYEYNSGTYSAWEDIVGGGDRDHNDVTFYVTATQQQESPITASGSVSVSDVDSGDTPTLPNTTVQGEFGSLTMTNGNWTYTFDPDKASAIDEETLETIVITDSEGGKHEIVIAIQGTDDAPIVTGVFSGAVTEGDADDVIKVSGTISISDVDADDTPEFENTTINGQYGSLTLVDGEWTYTLDPVKSQVLSDTDFVQDTITLTATDGTTQNVVISVTGTDDAPFVVGTNSATIVAPDSATQDYIDINNAFVLGDGYSFSGGDMQYIGNEPTLNFHDSGSTIRIYDTDSRMDGDAYSNEYVQDSSQKVEINGVLYTASYDYQFDYQDSSGNIYSFAVLDVDLDRDGGYEYDANEQGKVIIQIDGPTITPGISMEYIRDTPNQPSSMAYSDFVDGAVASLAAHGTLSLLDVDANDSQAVFANTTVSGQYGSLELVDGSWTYTLDPRSTPALGDNDTITEVITLTATNGAQTEVNVTIGGSENAITNASLSGLSQSLSDVISLDDVTFSGGDSNDRIAGSNSADVLLGNAGHDIILGGTGNDFIDGGLGDDLILGGQGNDVMAGGAGSDTFAFLYGDQGTSNEPAVDHIADFDTAQDAINLSDLLQAEQADTLESFLSLIDDGEGHAVLNISTNGDGSVDQQVVFDNMSLEDMASAYSVDISGMTSEQVSTSVIDAMVMQSKMIID